jgi:hypothetical protein
MAISTVASLNSLFNTIFEDAIFVMREQNLMAGLVTNYSASGMQGRELGIYPQLSAQTVSEGVDYSNATEWDKTLQMTITPKEEMVQVVLTDQRLATDPDDARGDAAREMGGAIATKLDEDLVGLFSSFSTQKGTANNALTIANCGAAVAVLRAAKAPNPLYFVLHPYQWHDIWTLLGQPVANQAFLGDTANEAMRSYYVGNFQSATWFVNSNIDIDSNSDATGAVFHREALALDTRKAPMMEVERDASLRGWELNMTAWYGVAVRRNNFGVKIISDATEPT